MEIETPEEFFNIVLPDRFKPEKAEGIDVVVQVKITGLKGGDWTAEIKGKRMNVTKGVHPSPNLYVEITDSDFIDLVNEKLSAQKAFFTGRIKFKGDIVLALKLRDIGFL